MGSTFRRMNVLAYQLQQAYAEGILDQTAVRNILNMLQEYTEEFIEHEQHRQLQEWVGSCDQAANQDSLQSAVSMEDESEEQIIYQEFIKSLPEGL